MNDGLDEMHSDREESILPNLKEAFLAFMLWLIVTALLGLSMAGCLS